MPDRQQPDLPGALSASHGPRRVSPGLIVAAAILVAAAGRVGAGSVFGSLPDLSLAAVGVAVLAIGLAGWSIRVLLRADRLPVEVGPYRFCRHPMYLAMVLVLVGVALFLREPWGLVSAGVTWFGLDRWAARPEEAELLSVFPEPYTAYVSRIGRWGPRIRRAGSWDGG